MRLKWKRHSLQQTSCMHTGSSIFNNFAQWCYCYCCYWTFDTVVQADNQYTYINNVCFLMCTGPLLTICRRSDSCRLFFDDSRGSFVGEEGGGAPNGSVPKTFFRQQLNLLTSGLLLFSLTKKHLLLSSCIWDGTLSKIFISDFYRWFSYLLNFGNNRTV